MSPSSACSSDVLPEPTGPATPTSMPRLSSTETSESVGGISSSLVAAAGAAAASSDMGAAGGTSGSVAARLPRKKPRRAGAF
eukprot:1134638-Prymnesium_polylepis.1